MSWCCDTEPERQQAERAQTCLVLDKDPIIHFIAEIYYFQDLLGGSYVAKKSS